MKAKYAAAIRRGVTAGMQASYGEPDDPYYELRATFLWGGIAGDKAAKLTLKAFTRTAENCARRRKAHMTPEERREAARVFKNVHARYVETGEERAKRLLREEVEALRAEVVELRAELKS